MKRGVLLQAPRPASEGRLVVFFAEEAGFAVMPALHDVQRNIIKMDAWAAGHGTIIEKLM